MIAASKLSMMFTHFLFLFLSILVYCEFSLVCFASFANKNELSLKYLFIDLNYEL